jgi:Asp-tRNA(Asn)/Glu-tRNA(Gln) amidotransferase A subunit family amidase
VGLQIVGPRRFDRQVLKFAGFAEAALEGLTKGRGTHG